MKYKRPKIPYEGKAMPNNTRYQILTQNHQPPTADMLDGEMNYCIDSMNALDKSIQAVVAGNIDGSDNPDNRNKVLKTDGAGNLSWVQAGEEQLLNQGVTTPKLRDRSVTTGKLDNQVVTIEKIADTDPTTKKEWANKIGVINYAEVGANANLVARNHEGAATFATILVSYDNGENDFGSIAVYRQGNSLQKASQANFKTRIGIDNINARLDALENGKSFLDKFHPVGSVYITFANQNPPMHGQQGVAWEALPEGHAVMTANGGNTGQRSGGNRLDTGSTAGHAVTINQMPGHTPGYVKNYAGHGQQTKNGTDHDAGIGQTQSNGGGQAHSHELNIYNQKLLFWKRIS